MDLPQLTDPQLAILGVFLLSIILLITEKYHRATSAMISAALMVYFGSYVYHIFRPEETLNFIDWHTLLFIVGVLIIVEGLSESGLFQFIGLKVAGIFMERKNLLFVSFMFLSLIVTLFLANFPAMLIMGAVTTSLKDRLGINVRKWIIYEALVCNSGAMGLMISSIPNLIVALNFNIRFNEFLLLALPLSLILTLVTAIIGVLTGGLYTKEKTPEDLKASVVVDKGKLARSFIIFLAFILLIVFNSPELPMYMVALLMAAVMLWMGGEDPDKLFSNLDWSTVFFLASFYVVVGGVEKVKLLDYVSGFMEGISNFNIAFLSILIWASGIMSGFVDNIPVALTFTSIIKTLPLGANMKFYALAVAIGANIGGNLTYFASPPSLVAVSILQREEGFSPMEFTKRGAPITLVHLIISELYLLLLSGFL